jgi:hypothetical protein
MWMCRRQTGGGGVPGCSLAVTGLEVGLEPRLNWLKPLWAPGTGVERLQRSTSASPHRVEHAVTAPTGDQLLIGSPRGRDSCHAPEVLSTRAMCGWSQRRPRGLTRHGRATAGAELTRLERTLGLSSASSGGRELYSRHPLRIGFAPGPS